MHTILTHTHTHTETDKPTAIREVLPIFVKILLLFYLTVYLGKARFLESLSKSASKWDG